MVASVMCALLRLRVDGSNKRTIGPRETAAVHGFMGPHESTKTDQRRDAQGAHTSSSSVFFYPDVMRVVFRESAPTTLFVRELLATQNWHSISIKNRSSFVSRLDTSRTEESSAQSKAVTPMFRPHLALASPSKMVVLNHLEASG